MIVDKTDDGAEENRKSFSAAGGCIHESAFTLLHVVPGLFLEGKRFMSAGVEQLADNLIAV